MSCSGPETIVEELISPVFADALRRLGAVLIVTDEIPRTQWTERIAGGRSMSWGLSLNKMQIFNMTQYRKIVFMDADTIVFKNLDHLFGPEYPMFTGASFMCDAELGGCLARVRVLVSNPRSIPCHRPSHDKFLSQRH